MVVITTYLFRKLGEALSTRATHTRAVGLEPPHNVLQGGRTEEVVHKEPESWKYATSGTLNTPKPRYRVSGVWGC